MRIRWASGLVVLGLGAITWLPATSTEPSALQRAGLLLRQGNADSALVLLTSAPLVPGLEAFTDYLTAEAASDVGRWDTAAAAVERARNATLPPEMQQRLLVVRGLVAEARGDLEAEKKLAPELGEAARRDDRTGLLLFNLANAAARHGDVVQARGWLFDLLEGRPTPAESAYTLLRSVPVSGNDALRLARYELRSGRAAAGRERLRIAQSQASNDAERAEMMLALAEAHLRAGEYSACQNVLERAAAPARNTRFEPERLRIRARAERRNGQRDAAIATYRELARRFPEHLAADDALYEVGWMFETRRALTTAERAYVRCERTFPNGSLADDSMLRAGLCALRDARPGEAAAHFRALAARYPHSTLLDNALYWHMLAQLEVRDAAGALGLRDRLERDFPRSYFTVLARRRVEHGLEREATVAVEGPESQSLGTDVGQARAMRAETAYAGAIETLRNTGLVPPGDFDTATRLWRFLLEADFRTEALWEARRLERVYAESPGALLEMIAIAHGHDANERLVRWAYLLGLRAREGTSPEALEILLYPAPYATLLAPASVHAGLSHAVVLGLMRQESAFDPSIDSGVGARGLMQLMPEVAKRMWHDAGKGDLHPDALYQPEISIELGCELLADEMRRAKGDVAQALAAYNAGGDVAETWKSRLGPKDPPEMYIDLAEYAETRTYLETVLGNTETYRRLYALP